MKPDGQRSEVRGIVLAGVHAWGESPLEHVCVRPLLPLAGRPIIWYVLDWLRQEGLPRASICANSDTRTFRRCLGETHASAMPLEYYEDIMPRGPAGCMRDAAERTDAQTFVVVDSTIATQVDLASVLRTHRQVEADLTVVVSESGAGGPMAGLEPAGIYVASRQVLEHVGPRGYQDIKEVLIPCLRRKGRRVVPYVAPDGSNLRVTGAASYLAASAWAIGRLLQPGQVPAGYDRVGDACVHRSARVSATACLAGPVVIGPQSSVQDRATIVGPTTIGAGCRIERETVIRQAAIWSYCRIGAGAIIDDSILVDGAVVEPALVVRDAVWTQAVPPRHRRYGTYWGLPGTAAGRPPHDTADSLAGAD